VSTLAELGLYGLSWLRSSPLPELFGPRVISSAGDMPYSWGDGKMRTHIVVLLALIVSGCAGKTILLKNDKGDVVRCEVSAGDAMSHGIFIRDRTLSNCIKEYEAAGYKRVSPE
jgi:hypothetical protein